MLKFAMVLSGNSQAAQDLVAVVFARAFEQWDRICMVDHPQAYLRRMIVNEHLSTQRRSAITARAERNVSRLLRVTPDPAEGVDERRAMVTRLKELTPQQRAAVVLRYYLDMSDADIADYLECRPATVRSHLSHALAALRIDQARPADTEEINHGH